MAGYDAEIHGSNTKVCPPREPGIAVNTNGTKPPTFRWTDLPGEIKNVIYELAFCLKAPVHISPY